MIVEGEKAFSIEQEWFEDKKDFSFA